METQPTTRQSQGIASEDGKGGKLEYSKESRTPGEHRPENQVSMAHTGSQTSKGQSRTPHGSELNPLRLCYGCIVRCSCGTLNRESKGCL